LELSKHVGFCFPTSFPEGESINHSNYSLEYYDFNSQRFSPQDRKALTQIEHRRSKKYKHKNKVGQYCNILKYRLNICKNDVTIKLAQMPGHGAIN
jgi:hypothetical protein